MTPVRTRAVVLAAAAAGLAAVLTPSAGSADGPQALDQRIDEQIDVGGLACVHLGARIAIPEQAGGPTELALKQASVRPGACSS